MTSTRPRRSRAGREPAAVDPVARVLVDVALPHLDRPFDYRVPSDLDAEVRPGSRVRVRFAGQLVDAYVLERRAGTDHPGTLAFVERTVGGEPVLTSQTADLLRAVADRWAGSFVDVLRLAVPARHARAERSVPADAVPPPVAPVPAGSGPAGSGPAESGPTASDAATPGFGRYRAGPAFLAAVAAGRPARAVWSALPDDDWPARIAEAVHTALAAGRGALIVVPDARDLARLERAVAHAVGDAAFVALSADLGPAERYRRWLRVRRGAVRAVIGTRAAVYAPVADLGLLGIWDDGDDLFAEPRAPYAHARDVLVLRSARTGAALLVGGYARTAEAQLLLASGWAHEIAAERAVLRRAAPRVVAAGDDAEQQRDPAAAAARLPSLAWRTTRDALAGGVPVLVQVPRRGYVPALACARDRAAARCPACSGPLSFPAAAAGPSCRWCGRPAGDWACPGCGGRALRAVVVGARRTAEELGRAFPGTAVRTSGGERVLDAVPARPELVIATPGAEPVAVGGYGAALLLDGWALLARADLRAGEETLRRWLNAAALVRPGGTVVVGADAALAPVQALIRWDPGGHAARELADRAELGFPPAVRMAALTGPPAAVRELLAGAELPGEADLIGPVPVAAGDERMLIRVPRARAAELAAALKAAAALRSARKAEGSVKIELDPAELV